MNKKTYDVLKQVFNGYLQPGLVIPGDGGDSYYYCRECRGYGWSESDIPHEEGCLFIQAQELLKEYEEENKVV